jgi:hypothetical protein
VDGTVVKSIQPLDGWHPVLLFVNSMEFMTDSTLFQNNVIHLLIVIALRDGRLIVFMTKSILVGVDTHPWLELSPLRPAHPHVQHYRACKRSKWVLPVLKQCGLTTSTAFITRELDIIQIPVKPGIIVKCSRPIAGQLLRVTMVLSEQLQLFVHFNIHLPQLLCNATPICPSIPLLEER